MNSQMAPAICFDDFLKVQLCVGRILEGNHLRAGAADFAAGLADDVRRQLSRRGLRAGQSGDQGLVAGARPAQCRRDLCGRPRQRA